MGIFDEDVDLGKQLNLPPRVPLLHNRARQSITIGQHTRFILTPIGKQKADNFTASGAKYDVMSHMVAEGSASPAELEDELSISLNKSKAILRHLLNAGYVKMSVEGIG